MKREGFTLIELLVVVLIVGILAAVALPQYQKAVDKSRYVQAKTLAKSIVNAEEVYYLANGKYTADFRELSVDVPTPLEEIVCDTDSEDNLICQATYSWGNCAIVATDGGRNNIQCKIKKNGRDFLLYVIGFTYSTWHANQALCVAYGENATRKPIPTDISYQICANETNRKTPSSSFGSTSDSWQY